METSEACREVTKISSYFQEGLWSILITKFDTSNMSSLSFPYYEESIIELLDPVLTEVSHSNRFLCDECESDCSSNEIHFCGSCTRHLCSDCFLSDFDSLCYDCTWNN